jgi:BMFP domain-containing protein YqiC
MQTNNRFMDDLAKVANSAVSTLSGIKGEVEAIVRQQLDRLLSDMDLVHRDEFDAVQAMAAKARTEQEKLEKRVKSLEAALAGKPASKSKKTAAKPNTKSAPKTK